MERLEDQPLPPLCLLESGLRIGLDDVCKTAGLDFAPPKNGQNVAEVSGRWRSAEDEQKIEGMRIITSVGCDGRIRREFGIHAFKGDKELYDCRFLEIDGSWFSQNLPGSQDGRLMPMEGIAGRTWLKLALDSLEWLRSRWSRRASDILWKTRVYRRNS